MKRSDLTALDDRLKQLADALQGRAPSAAGLLVWLDALTECAMDDVLSVLTDWPRGNARMPLPVDVLRLARDRLSERIERQAAIETAANRQPWSVEQLRGDPNSPGYLAFREAIAAMKLRPRPHPRDWAHRLREREATGERLSLVQRAYWREALGVSGTRTARTAESPDEREARLEREAIQSESRQS